MQVHGLKGTMVDCDWAPLTFAELETLIAAYPQCGALERVCSISPRPFSAASVVETTAGRVFVKRHRQSVRTVEGLTEEHGFLAHLHAHGAAVAEVLKTSTGATAAEQDGWVYEVHTIPAGVDAYSEALSWTPFQYAAHAHAAGAMLAKLHLAAEGYDAPRRQPRPLVASFSIFATGDPRAGLAQYMRDHPALDRVDEVRICAERALEILEPFAAELRPLLPALSSLWTHNDLHASNLFWSGTGPEATVTAAIDFGLADCTFAVHDIAHAIERNIVEWLSLFTDPTHPEAVPIYFDQLDALLEGYESVRPLLREEALALAPTMALCHAEFALTEADYYLTALHDEGRAKVAYDDYLVGHAQWFLGPGAKLLDALRSWAAQHAASKEYSL